MSIDFLTSVVEKMEQTKVDFDLILEKKDVSEKVIKINPEFIGNWEYRDRQPFELGSIEDLAESIIHKGQAQPIIVVESDSIFRSNDDKIFKYIVIAGYRRWLACKSKNICVDAIVRKFTFEQAVSCLVSENEKEIVSDYSKGMFYYNLLKKEKVSKKDLYEKLGLKKGVFDNYLSFSEVPLEVWDAVGDLRMVSARSSSTIKLICQKSDKHLAAIISIAKKISEGIGEKKIKAMVDKKLSGESDVSKLSSATRVAISNNILMYSTSNQIKINFKELTDQNIDFLKEKISVYLKEISNYL